MNQRQNTEDFGDFEEIKSETQDKGQESSNNSEANNIPSRIREPRRKELIGMVIQRHGGNRMDVKTTDGKTRNCRVPGRYKRRLWLRPKSVVLIIPWEDNDEKGDIIYKYPPAALNQLRKRGILDSVSEDF